MKSQLINYLIGFISILFLFSISACSIEKRRYQDGYHVEWHSKKTKAEKLTREKCDQVQNESSFISQDSEINSTALNEAASEIGDSKDEFYVSKDDQLLVLKEKNRTWNSDTIIRGYDSQNIKESEVEINGYARDSENFGSWGIVFLIMSVLIRVLLTGAQFATIAVPLAITLGLVALIFGSYAISWAKKAKREMAAFPGRYGNGNEAKVGLVLGWIVVGVVGVFTLWVVMGFLLNLFARL